MVFVSPLVHFTLGFIYTTSEGGEARDILYWFTLTLML